MNRFFGTVLVILVVCFSAAYAHADEPIRWDIVKVERGQLCVQNTAISSDAVYALCLSPNGSERELNTWVDSADIRHLLEYFNVETTDRLVGKWFWSRGRTASRALDYLITTDIYGGGYYRPGYAELLEYIARAFSKTECPDFSGFDKDQVDEFIDRAKITWPGDSSDEFATFLADLNERISALSNGRVKLTEVDCEEFPGGCTVRGPARYLLLTQEGEKAIKVIMGPYRTPIWFP